eukprot:g2557.t1
MNTRQVLVVYYYLLFAVSFSGAKSCGRFAGKNILVTGGDSGIGLATVIAFRKECGRVLMVGHNETKTRMAFENVSKSIPVPSYCNESSVKFDWTAIDISKFGQVSAAIERIVENFGGLDIAVNDAGSVGHYAPEIGDRDFMSYFNSSVELHVNLIGTMNCLQQEIRQFLVQNERQKKTTKGGWSIVNVASVCGQRASVGNYTCQSSYATTKWAEYGLTKEAALQYAKAGIRINVVSPGVVLTPMITGGLGPSDPEWIKIRNGLNSMIPMGRIADPSEVAAPILFLSSDDASYMTGSVMTVGGGLDLT